MVSFASLEMIRILNGIYANNCLYGYLIEHKFYKCSKTMDYGMACFKVVFLDHEELFLMV